MFGWFKRDHWVTLHYDPKTDTATLLDSRPWLVSFLYPTSSMKESLMRGITKLYDPEKANKMKFTTSYQGVQHNDTYCGAWTSRNVLDLATGGDIKTQKNRYNSSQEITVLKDNYEKVMSGCDLLMMKDKPNHNLIFTRDAIILVGDELYYVNHTVKKVTQNNEKLTLIEKDKSNESSYEAVLNLCKDKHTSTNKRALSNELDQIQTLFKQTEILKDKNLQQSVMPAVEPGFFQKILNFFLRKISSESDIGISSKSDIDRTVKGIDNNTILFDKLVNKNGGTKAKIEIQGVDKFLENDLDQPPTTLENPTDPTSNEVTVNRI